MEMRQKRHMTEIRPLTQNDWKFIRPVALKKKTNNETADRKHNHDHREAHGLCYRRIMVISRLFIGPSRLRSSRAGRRTDAGPPSSSGAACPSGLSGRESEFIRRKETKETL